MGILKKPRSFDVSPDKILHVPEIGTCNQGQDVFKWNI